MAVLCASLAALVLFSGIAAAETANQCAFSRVYAVTDAGKALVSEETSPLWDGDQGTTLRVDSGSALEILFIGAPRWVNSIAWQGGPGEISVDLLDLGGEWVFFARGAVDADGFGSMDGKACKARGLRIVPAEAESLTLSEFGAAFEQSDPDGRDDYEYFYNYTNDYYGTDDDITNCDNNVSGIYNNIPSYWVNWGYSSYSASPSHYESESYGGSEDSFVDRADLSFYCGHGTGSGSWRGWAYRSDTFYPQYAHDSWGERDLEWVASVACQAMHDDAIDEWAQAMNGMHLICGATTNMRQGNYGKTFAKKMVDSGAFDSAKKVKASWFDTVEAKNPSGRQGVVIGENSNMGNDYLWGQGTVQSDPEDNSGYYRWRYNTSGWLARDEEPPLAALDPGLQTFPASSGRGLTVLIDPSLLDGPSRETLPVFDPIPVIIDSIHVRNKANAFCQEFGYLCGGDIGPGDDGEVNLIDGAIELRVCENSGSIHFERTDKWLEPRNARPNLLMDDQAIEGAEQTLFGLGLRPGDANVTGVDYMWQAAVEIDTNGEGHELQDSTFAIASRVLYHRSLDLGGRDQMPVFGPGGSMSVAMGDEGELERVFMGAWRPVAQAGSVNLIDIQAVIERLSEQGSGATMDGIPIPADSIFVQAVETGYFDTGCDDPAERLYPVYRLISTVFSEGSDPSQFDIMAWADGLNPFPKINAPAEGAVVSEGSVICFEGEVIDGQAPFEFAWQDEMGNVLSHDLNFCTELYAAPNEAGVPDSSRTLAFVVKDARGRKSTALVTVVLSEVTDADDLAPPSAFTLSRNHPNPFNPMTTISFQIPERAGNQVPVKLAVYDVSGRQIRVLTEAVMGPGTYSFVWDGRDGSFAPVSSGVYFFRIDADKYHATQKMTLLK